MGSFTMSSLGLSEAFVPLSTMPYIRPYNMVRRVKIEHTVAAIATALSLKLAHSVEKFSLAVLYLSCYC